MKNLITMTFCILFFACNEPDKAITVETNPVIKNEKTEQEVKDFIEGYIKAIESSEWKTRILPYSDDATGFIADHEKFRKAFSDYKINVKHLVIQGNECVMWAKITVKFIDKFDGNELKNTAPTNKPLEWTEIWYFDVVNGKFTDNFDFLDDGISRMKQVGIECLPK